MFDPEEVVDTDKARQEEKKRFMAIIIGLIVTLIILAGVVFALSINKVHRISIPPKLEFGTIVNTGEIDHFEIYSLAGLVTQQLNLWGNGEKDFKANIHKFGSYITPEYRAFLLAEENNLLRTGQLTDRERSLQPIGMYQADNVKKQSDGWLIEIVFKQQEHINNQRFKDFRIKHFIKVVYRDIDPEKNPWGLQLDVPWKQPIRLKDK